MASSSHFSSPLSSSSNWRYDVYPSFHGADVRISFLSQILKEFRSKGIVPFIDGEIRQNNLISFDLMEAIRGSRIAIVMLSRNYASSSWCLNELVEIMKCREDVGQVVVPIFYKVDRIEVMFQTGEFGKIFRKTCRGKTKEDIERWRQALAEVTKIGGYHSKNLEMDAEMSKTIASHVSNKLTISTPSSDFDGLVGTESHLIKMGSLLQLDSGEVKKMRILGPSGNGKTTIAGFLSKNFQPSVLILPACSGDYSEKPSVLILPACSGDYSAKLHLKQQFMSQLINEERQVVIGSMDHLQQVEFMANENFWFGLGSRIHYISTQVPKLLKPSGVNHMDKVDFPSSSGEALQLFCFYAFGQMSPKDGFKKLAWEVTRLAGKNPVRLCALGSYFQGMSKEKWKNILPQLRSSLEGETLSITDSDYGSLSGRDKKLSHHHISRSNEVELIERVEILAEHYSEVGQELIIKNQDLKEDLSTNESSYEKPANALVHIYCEETLQYSFASHLSMDFRRKGINAFVNCTETLGKIGETSAFVVVFSNSYYSSTSYMDSLVRVLQCQKKTGQLVVPVFYGISPSDVVVHDFESADQIREWSGALQELRELQGYQLREECSECELVEEIVKDVYEKLFPTEKIGINSRLLEIEQLLCKQPWGIRRIGIWGMPGIGKTTLAQAFFDQISGGYEVSCFINDFDKAFHEKGLHHMLEKHFGKFWEEISNKITLVVLDDVHNPLVAESFLRGIHWFGPGSLIIMTSRDKKVFRHCQVNHVYEVQSLNQKEALQLFYQCAFGKDEKEQYLRELPKEVIDYANRNPLALSFCGGELKGKTLSEMVTTFLKLKHRTPYKIYDLFKSSYDTLTDIEKNIFLDIACFFNGEKVEYVMQLLEGCDFFPHVGIDVLVEKCLVTISEKRVKMHKIIQDFGREIINRETILLERRRRLWEPQTIRFLLKDDKLEANEEPTSSWAMNTEDIEGIFLDISNLLFDVKPTAFENMLNLRLLKIYNASHTEPYGLGLPKGLDSLPYELRLLHWDYYPLQSLPQDFDPCHLVELNMPNSKLQKLWGGTKDLKMLKMVKLCHSKQLTEIDELCKAQNIELIELQGCKKLQSFPATDHLQHLRVVNLSGCREITSFPEVSPNIEQLHLQETGIRELPISIGNATHLKILDLSDCSSLVELPSSLGNATNLRKLYLTGCSSLVELPTSIGNANKVELLNLCNCSSLVELPSSVGNVTNLQYLNLSCCSWLVKLPSSFGISLNLKELLLVGCSNLVELPTDIGNATKLEVLDLSDCSSLITLPASIGNVTNLKNLYLSGCSNLVELPASIGNATKLNVLDLTNCSNLVGLPSSIGNVTNLQILNLENCSKLMELPWSFGNTLNVKQLYLAGCSSLVDLPSSIRNSTSLMSIDRNEDNSEFRRALVRRAKKGDTFLLIGEREDENSVYFHLRIEDGNGRRMNIMYMFFLKDDTASKVSRDMVKELRLTDEYTTFIAQLMDILLVNMITNWKTDLAINHLTHCLLNQNKEEPQGEEETAFHDVCKPVSHLWTSDYVDDIKVNKSSNQEVEEATEPVSMEEKERLRQELDEIEAKYQEEMQEIARKKSCL